MNMIKDNLRMFIKYLIIVIFSVIALYLFYLAGFSTSVISTSEHVFLIKDSFFGNTLFTFLFICLLLCIYHAVKKVGFLRKFLDHVNSDTGYYNKCRKLLLLAYFVLLCTYIIAVQKEAVTDRLGVFESAAQWMDGNFSSLTTGYLVTYPHQLGIVLFLYAFSHIFGAFNYIAFQLLNAVCITCTYKAFSELSDLSGNSNAVGLLIVIFCVLFIPTSLYATFAYGTFIGLCLSVNAFKHIYIYISQPKQQKIGHAVISFIELFFAVIIKSNFLIFAIAYVIICFILLCKKPSFKAGMPIIISLCIILFNKPLVNGVVEAITQTSVPDGLPTLSWVFLGLEENTDIFDGWWNKDAMLIFYESGFDTTTANYIFIEKVQNRLRYMLSEPGYAATFFARKNAAQWNNSDFEAFFVNNVPSSIKNANLFRQLLSARGAAAISPILNRMHFIILSGVVLFLFARDKHNYVSLFYCVTVIGGFVFHTAWEGKSQYTLPYFMLLIPLSAIGYSGCIRVLTHFSSVKKKQKRIYAIAATLIFAFALVIHLTSDSSILKKIFCLDEGTAEYEDYVSSLNESGLDNGEYEICSYVGSSVLSTNEDWNLIDQPVTFTLSSDTDTTAKNIRVVNSEYGDGFFAWIDCGDGGRVLAVEAALGEDEMSNARVSAYKVDYAQPVRWQLIKDDVDDTYYLVYNDYALTYEQDTDTLVLSTMCYDNNQKWVIVPANSK